LIHIEAGEKRAKHEHEEINRLVVDALSDVHLCVSQRAVVCLSDEGKTENVYWTGDLAYDFLKSHLVNKSYEKNGENYEFILATVHRPENLKIDALKNIIQALGSCSKKVLFVCHPKTKQLLQEMHLIDIENIDYIDALSYSNMLATVKASVFLFTDSGGLIREASHLGKRCLVRRDEGGWQELIQAGYNIRVGTKLEDLKRSLVEMISLSAVSVPPPEILYRTGGTEYALKIICDFAKGMKVE